MPPVLPQQPQAHRRLPELPDGQRLRLAVVAADPFPGQAEFGHRGLDVNRRKVAGGGELDAVDANAVKQPGIRTDHPGRGRRVDQHQLQDPAVDDEAQEIDPRERVTERGDQILDLRRELRTHAAGFT
jgi:hypothetical protein